MYLLKSHGSYKVIWHDKWQKLNYRHTTSFYFSNPPLFFSQNPVFISISSSAVGVFS